MGKFSKFCSESIHCNTDRRTMFKFHEVFPMEAWWNRALFTSQKNMARWCMRHCELGTHSIPASEKYCGIKAVMIFNKLLLYSTIYFILSFVFYDMFLWPPCIADADIILSCFFFLLLFFLA